jgi:sugar phosphate isomerase/epimerase
MPLGAGEVDWPAFLAALQQGGFKGDFVVEREAGNQRVPEILSGKTFIEQIFLKIESKEFANRPRNGSGRKPSPG